MYERVFSKAGLSLDRLRVLTELDGAGSIAKAAGRASMDAETSSRCSLDAAPVVATCRSVNKRSRPQCHMFHAQDPKNHA